MAIHNVVEKSFFSPDRRFGSIELDCEFQFRSVLIFTTNKKMLCLSLSRTIFADEAYGHYPCIVFVQHSWFLAKDTSSSGSMLCFLVVLFIYPKKYFI